MALVLGIETSCDETSVALVRDGHEVLANVVSSQIAKHALYGGVIPELAAREHLEAIWPICRTALREAQLAERDVDAIAVTSCPGLLPALLVGLAYAKGLAIALDRPLLGINHILAHLYGAFLEDAPGRADPANFPLLGLVVSGGHTLLLVVQANGDCRVLGETIDDAAGEAFDKAARILHLPYPGGPVIDRLARQGNPRRFSFPRALTGAAGHPIPPGLRLHFSFSGVKTSMLYHLRDLAREQGAQLAATPASEDDLGSFLREQDLLDTVASYQEAVVDVLVRKAFWAAAECGARSLAVAGGVACNSRLRERLQQESARRGLPLRLAAPRYCTDNAAMVAGLAWYQWRRQGPDGLDLDAAARSQPLRHAPFAPLA